MGNKEFRDLMMSERQNIINTVGTDGWGENKIYNREATAIATVNSLKMISQRMIGKVSVEEQNTKDAQISKRIQRVSNSFWYKRGVQQMSASNWAPEEIV